MILDDQYNAVQTVKERIRQLRSQMLTHGYLYYEIYSPIISDAEWQKRANELAKINQPIGLYDEAFSDWDGTTGFHLPKDDWVNIKLCRF